MNTVLHPWKFPVILAVGLLLALGATACLPPAVTPIQTPIIQLVPVNREVTRVVTREVTRIVEVPVPVTLTPSPTPLESNTPTFTPTSTDTPTATLTPVPPQVTILIHTPCLFGPSPAYISRYDLLASSQQTVIGRSRDGSWLYVDGPDHKIPCWVQTMQVKVNSGRLIDPPVTDPVLTPWSTLYPPPPVVSTNRAGNMVTIFWQPVPMTEADYNGYLVEAWVCQGGQQVFEPRAFVTSFDQNSSMLGIQIQDDPGCLEPSSARIYTVEKHAYSNWKKVPWPAPATPTPGPSLK